jgi:hypothetical protein
MELSLNVRRSVNTGPIATKIGAKVPGKCQLSFALFFLLHPEKFLPKELSQIFAPIPGGGMQFVGRCYLC